MAAAKEDLMAGQIERKGNVMHFAIAGVIAGAVSTLVFTAIHDLFISDIWAMLPIMLLAGIICGGALAGSFAYLVDRPSLQSWLIYNALYLAMFVLLGLGSELIFEPVLSMAVLVSNNAPPDDLIVQALPYTAIFTLGMAVFLTLVYGWSQRRFAVIFGTCLLLVVLLGLNVSVIGLVSIPRGSLYLILEMFALIVALNVVYVAMFVVLKWKNILPEAISRPEIF